MSGTKFNFTIFDNVLDSVIVIKQDGALVYCNEALTTLTDISYRQLRKGGFIKDFMRFDPPDVFKSENLLDLSSATPYAEVSFKSSVGKEGVVQVSVQPLDDGADKFLLVYMHDVSLEQRLQMKYRAELEQKEGVIEHLEIKLLESSVLLEVSKVFGSVNSSEGILTGVVEKLISLNICSGATVIHSNPGQFSIKFLTTEIKSPELRVRGTTQAVPAELHDVLVNEIKNYHLFHLEVGSLKTFYEKYLQSENLISIFCFPLKTKNFDAGVIHFVKGEGNNKNVGEKSVSMFQAVAHQLTLAMESAQFFEKSITDEMTQLYNRRYFMSRLDVEIKKTNRSTDVVGLVMFDVDHFKKFNDTYGHQTGDLVLKSLAEVIKKTCRIYDIPARYGGEEFIIVIPNIKAQDQDTGPLIFAERLRKAVEAMELKAGDQTLKVTISLGVALAPVHAKDPDGLIAAADKALYQAKRSGRNKSIVYTTDMVEIKPD